MTSIFYCTIQAPGIFPAIIKELAGAIGTSSVPVMTKVGLDIFESSSQMPFQFVALQLSTTLNCCTTVLTGTPGNKSSAFGMVSRELGCSLIHVGPNAI